MLLSFLLGYAFGLLFYLVYFPWLIHRAKVTQRPLGRMWLLIPRWIVMPLLVVAAAALVYGRIDVNAAVALSGYIGSRVVRWVKVQVGSAPSDPELLNRLAQQAEALD